MEGVLIQVCMFVIYAIIKRQVGAGFNNLTNAIIALRMRSNLDNTQVYHIWAQSVLNRIFVLDRVVLIHPRNVGTQSLLLTLHQPGGTFCRHNISYVFKHYENLLHNNDQR